MLEQVTKQIFKELFTELSEIIEREDALRKRGKPCYNITSSLKDELSLAKTLVNVMDGSGVSDLLNQISVFFLEFKKQFKNRNTKFILKIHKCFHCVDEDPQKKCICGPNKKNSHIYCSMFIQSPTFTTLKGILKEALKSGKKGAEDIDIIYDYLESIYALIEKHKQR